MIQLGKYEKYLIEEFFDDYRAGTMSQHTFTRRVAFITGSMTAAAAAMAMVGCTPQELPRSTDPMPTPSVSGSGTDSAANPSAGAVPGAKSPLSVPEGATGLVTSTVRFPSGGTDIAAYLARPEGGEAGPAVLVCHENRALPALRDALTATGVRHELTVYPGVDHAFHNDTGDRYNEAQATAAWNDTLSWFGKYV